MINENFEVFLCSIKGILADGVHRMAIIEHVKTRLECNIQFVMRSDDKKSTFNPLLKDGD